MSAKFLQAFTDENRELQKQIGCMTGIFQIFDRQNLITAGRRIHSHGHSHKKLTYVPANSSREIHQAEDGMNFSHKVLEKDLKKSLNNDKRTSVESSRTSFSSSSCSSFSSQQEVLPFELTNYQEKSFKESSKVKTFNIDGRPPRHERDPPISSNQTARRSLDFRDVVKDSINRDSKSLLTKSPTLDIDIKNNHVSKYVDSPRPLHISKSMNESKTRDQLSWNFSDLKESPRPSFEMSRQSLDSREGSKLCTNKLQELPRLSLDSKVEQNQSLILKEIDRRDRNQMALLDSKQKGSTSVVAKLMGLEEMPSLSIVTQIQNSTTLEEYKEEKEDHFLHSARKSIDFSRLPIEAAPWRKQEKIHVSPKTNIIHQKKLFYNETERRLNELEFTESSKDLRALKQILDAMQAKGLLETSKCNKKQNFVKGRAMGNCESPIVIMKPKNSVKKSGIRSSSVIPLDRLSMDKRKVSASNQLTKEHPINLGLNEASDKNKSLPRTTQRESSNTSNSLSPRLQKSRNLTDNKKTSDSVSPRTKLRNKPLTRHANELLCEEITQRSDRNTGLASHVDAEVTSPCRSTENFLISQQGSPSPSSKAARKVASIVKQKKPSIDMREENSNMESVSTEQPSPVSVLGSSFQQDNLPLIPLKKSSRNHRDEKDQNPEENITSKNLKKFQNINNLLQKLTELSSTDNKLSTTDHIASLCETQDPDHRYISEILLASGLLFKDFNTGSAPIKLHPSGHPINPDLFLVLEQTKNKSESMNKVRRKFLFDAVNEVLVRKLGLYSEGKFPSGQKLLKELCVDVERLQKCDENSNDGTKIVGRWEEMKQELPGLVLDIERSIFKELIDEVVNGEIMASSVLKTRRRRKHLTL